jgi:hypothetical protein
VGELMQEARVLLRGFGRWGGGGGCGVGLVLWGDLVVDDWKGAVGVGLLGHNWLCQAG